MISRKVFADGLALHNSSFLTNQEMKYLMDRFGTVGGSMIDFEELSKQMGLHSNSLQIMKATKDKI